MQKDEFKTKAFPSLSRFQVERSAVPPLRVCIATEEIFGPIRNGGIASTYYHLARTLAGDGHDVTVLYLPGKKCENATIEHWIEFYRNLHIRFVPLPVESSELICPFPRWQRPMYEFYHWLKSEEPFDVVHSSEYRGGAYYALLAKRHALAFENTLFLVKASSPWIWNRHYRMLPLGVKAELGRMYPERRIIELADLVIGGSAHLLTFMEQKGYRLPVGRTFVQPNIIDLQDLDVEDRRPGYEFGDRVKSSELVFFGRLEARKGLDTFCEAITRLTELGVNPTKITFLGKQGERLPAYPGTTSIEFIRRQAKNWSFPVEIIDSYDQDKAIGYLCDSPRIAVMPSVIENSTMAVYECLVHKIPFLATTVGGTPELISTKYHDRVLIDPHPESLANALQSVLRDGGTIAEGTFDYLENLSIWRDFHRYLAVALEGRSTDEVVNEIGMNNQNKESIEPRSAEANLVDSWSPVLTAGPNVLHSRPRVSVCVYYHQRSTYLEVLLESLTLQDCDIDEVVIMNDGSPEKDVRRILNRLEERSSPLGWRDFNQPHRCIGPALNAAVGQASGELIVFLNAERHYCEPNLISVFRCAASKSSAAAFACFSSQFKGRRPDHDADQDVCVVPIGGDLATAFYEDGCFGGSCFAVRRTVFQELGGFYDGYHIGGIEKEFQARLVLSGYELDVVPELLYRQRLVHSVTPFDQKSKEYLVIRPFLRSVPYFLENILLTARMLARKIEIAESECQYYRCELAMVRGEWEGASERWGEMRRTFPDHWSGYVRGAEALMRADRLEEAEWVAAEAVERFPDQSRGLLGPPGPRLRCPCRGEWAPRTYPERVVGLHTAHLPTNARRGIPRGARSAAHGRGDWT